MPGGSVRERQLPNATRIIWRRVATIINGYNFRHEGKSHKKHHQVLRLNCQNCLPGHDNDDDSDDDDHLLVSGVCTTLADKVMNWEISGLRASGEKCGGLFRRFQQINELDIQISHDNPVLMSMQCNVTQDEEDNPVLVLMQ